MKSSPFISLQDITIRIGEKTFFENTSFEFYKGQQWLIFGPNGSGKSTLAKAIAGILPLKQGKIILDFLKDKSFDKTQGLRHPYPSVHKDKIEYISFETQANLLKRDSLKRDLESYMGVSSGGTKVKDYLKSEKNLFVSEEFLDREISTLSTGEMRKVFLTKAISSSPKLLILDEPFDGLDVASKKILMDIISQIMKKIMVMIIVHRIDEVPNAITNIMLIKDLKIQDSGEKEFILKIYPDIFLSSRKILQEKQVSEASPGNKIFIDMSGVSVNVGNKKILNNINWTVREGENWAVLGPNGAGKSTLISLINGDQLQSYSNDIYIFGKKRSEIPLYEIKKNIGIVSSDLMLKYQYQLSGFEVILSGFFDSIGLYKIASKTQKKRALEWVKKLNLQSLTDRNYQELSFGQKRMVLIARAVVKSPKLLILDEPCHGLDHENRTKVLEIIETIGAKSKTQIILITHNYDEIMPCINQVLNLKEGKISS